MVSIPIVVIVIESSSIISMLWISVAIIAIIAVAVLIIIAVVAAISVFVT
jgi:hypothetical protein